MGIAGKTHRCDEAKVEKNLYRRSLKDSGFNDYQCNTIWDFYVARSFAAATGNQISLDNFGWKNTNSKVDGLPALEERMKTAASLPEFCIIRSRTINDTLAAMDLLNSRICISHPRAVIMQDFSFESDENEQVKIKSGESRINAIFRHIRNSFAHGNTYFFENGMCLLEDKDKGKITAEILVSKQSVLDWIQIVDRNHSYYPDASDSGLAYAAFACHNGISDI